MCHHQWRKLRIRPTLSANIGRYRVQDSAGRCAPDDAGYAEGYSTGGDVPSVKELTTKMVPIVTGHLIMTKGL
jgi:hypothetical protein